MDIEIREYETKYFSDLIPLVNNFEDYLIALDDMGRLRRGEKFAEQYLTYTLEEVRDKEGKFYVACDGDKVIGIGVGVHEEQSPQLTLEQGKRKCGRVSELFVEDAYRGQKVGKMLLQKLEEYFQKTQCDDIVIEAFSRNPKAQNFYKSFGYRERSIEFLKELTLLK